MAHIKNIVNRIFSVAKSMLTKRFFYGYAYNFFKKFPILRGNYVLFESQHGKDFFGNPYYIAKFLASSPDFSDYLLVMVGPNSKKKWVKEKLGGGNVKTVKPNSFSYVYYLARCKWLVSDITFPIYFSRREGQIYLNTWHGTPLKNLGRDILNENFSHILNPQRNFLHANYLLAPNHYTENILTNAYMLKNIWEGEFFRCGYPRNDILFKSRERIVFGEQIDIAFMPTWRGNFTTKKQASALLLGNLKTLLKFLDENLPAEINLWVRLHPLVQGDIDFDGFENIHSFPENSEPYEHLAQCHALVTDYSSVMFDYVNTLRPIVLYTPDEDDYRSDRDMYISLDELPFNRVNNRDDLLQALRNIKEKKNSLICDEKYLRFARDFCSWDDGDNSERICKSLFNQEDLLNKHQCKRDVDKQRLIIYAGALLNNGIIRSFKTILPMIDREKYDITILADYGYELREAESYFYSLGKDVKYIPLSLNFYASPFEVIQVLWIFFLKREWMGGLGVFYKVWHREYKRLVGNANFDVFINFNGYSWRAAFLSLGMDFKKVIYVHNEMVRELNAKRVADARLLKLSYEVSDAVAIVREGVENDYCFNIYNYKDKIVFVPNAILPDVLERASAPLSDAFSELYPLENVEKVKMAVKDERKFNFINVARFSPEKGQSRLIDAFEEVWKLDNNVQLILVGGHGICLQELQEKASQSTAKDSIFIIIGSGNPFPLVKLANAFIFSSYYEGIGLVLFEAMQLNIPIISTDIPGPRELLQDGYGLIVENSREGLKNGMLKAIENKVPQKKYNFSEHNNFALNQFNKCLEFASKNE